MTDKIINFLTLKNILLIIITSILATFITMIGVLHYLMDTLSWGMVIALLMIITIPFIIAHGVPKLPIVIFLRDIHQSNLDDIEQQQLEEPLDVVVVKEQISNSAAAFWFFLFLLICCVSFLMSQESIGVIDWLIALSIIAAPLILAYFVGEWFVDKDDIEMKELEAQKLS